MIKLTKVEKEASKHFAEHADEIVFLEMEYLDALAVFSALQRFYRHSSKDFPAISRERIRDIAGVLQDSLKVSDETGLTLEVGWHDRANIEFH